MFKRLKRFFKKDNTIKYKVVLDVSISDQKHVNKHAYTESTNSNIHELINFFHYTNCGSYTFDCFSQGNISKILNDNKNKNKEK